MKLSKRNLENAARKAEKLAAGKPVVSEFAKKRMTEEEYRANIEAHRKAVEKHRGVVAR